MTTSAWVISSQEVVPTGELPSEETYRQIQGASGVPHLRASPTDVDDSEKPQKVPLQAANGGHFLLLSISLGSYTLYKTYKRRKQKV